MSETNDRAKSCHVDWRKNPEMPSRVNEIEAFCAASILPVC